MPDGWLDWSAAATVTSGLHVHVNILVQLCAYASRGHVSQSPQGRRPGGLPTWPRVIGHNNTFCGLFRSARPCPSNVPYTTVDATSVSRRVMAGTKMNVERTCLAAQRPRSGCSKWRGFISGGAREAWRSRHMCGRSCLTLARGVSHRVTCRTCHGSVSACALTASPRERDSCLAAVQWPFFSQISPPVRISRCGHDLRPRAGRGRPDRARAARLRASIHYC